MGDLRYVRFSSKRPEPHVFVSRKQADSELGMRDLECSCQFECIINHGRKERVGVGQTIDMAVSRLTISMRGNL